MASSFAFVNFFHQRRLLQSQQPFNYTGQRQTVDGKQGLDNQRLDLAQTNKTICVSV
jgi:hypothetical protein